MSATNTKLRVLAWLRWVAIFCLCFPWALSALASTLLLLAGSTMNALAEWCRARVADLRAPE